MNVVTLAEQTVEPVIYSFNPDKWFYGIVMLAVLLVALVIVMMFNVDRFKSDH